MRGFWGIILYQPKFIVNLGTIVRSLGNFGGAFICTVGQRYDRGIGDTQYTIRNVPGFHFSDLESCLASLPVNARIVSVEVGGVVTLPTFHHPERAVYVFGGEDRTVPPIPGAITVQIPSRQCLNLAVAASLVMYDRVLKNGQAGGAVSA